MAKKMKRSGRAGKAKPKAKRTSRASQPGKSSGAAKATKASKGGKVVLLSGGNPQIAKADGDAAAAAYIAAMPGWKRAIGRRLDGLITRTVPGVQKAVRWNSPFYGVEGRGWFLSYHCISKYVKVAFFKGTSLRPIPPVESKHKEVRYFHVHENDEIDEKQFASWVRQASEMPGAECF